MKEAEVGGGVESESLVDSSIENEGVLGG